MTGAERQRKYVARKKAERVVAELSQLRWRVYADGS